MQKGESGCLQFGNSADEAGEVGRSHSSTSWYLATSTVAGEHDVVHVRLTVFLTRALRIVLGSLGMQLPSAALSNSCSWQCHSELPS